MKIKFYKYEGTGNDFVIVDNIRHKYDLNNLTEEIIEKVCDRKFGVGADGFIILEESEENDFEMVYYNSDGRKSSMCGNGGRCILHLAYTNGHCGRNARFGAIDGVHLGKIDDLISVKLRDVHSVESDNGDYILDTGSPHYISFRSNISDIPIIEEAHKIRYNDNYKSEGINVNFVEKHDEFIKLRTYERGVEDETLSCGTGVTAAAIAASVELSPGHNTIKVKAVGGDLNVSFIKEGSNFTDVWLTGPVNCVFTGECEIS